MNIDNELIQDDLENSQTISYLRKNLPKEVMLKFTDKDLILILNLIYEYYADSSVLEKEADSSGYVDIELDAVADYVCKKAKQNENTEYSYEDILLLVEGELDSHEN